MESISAAASKLSLLCSDHRDANLAAPRPNSGPPSFLNLNCKVKFNSLSAGQRSEPPRATAEIVADDVVEKGEESRRVLTVGLICGGPSAERGISLNSVRSVLDHIQGDHLQVNCYYIDFDLNAFAISPAQVYSNTPADFDFKLESLAWRFSSLSEFAEHLAESVDIVFPVIHGKFGEDGGIQELLEKHNIPFVGTGSSECRRAFDKVGFQKVFICLQVKPVRAGSSIGVSVAYGIANALKNAKDVILEGIDDKVIVEIFLEGGSEFTAIILDVGSGSDCQPVVLIPSEVELHFSEKDAIFNYRRKYLPTRQVSYHTPPRFPLEVITSIREGASQLFRQLGLRDFARIDGWFLPSSTNSFSDADGKFGKYSLVLRHTVEEVLDACIEATDPARASLTSRLRKQVIHDLLEGLTKHKWFNGFDIADASPEKFSLEEWIKHAKEVQATVFLSGPGISASKICMDKVATSLAVSHAHGMIEMPNPPPESLIFEPFIETDEIIVSSKSADGLLWKGQSRWVEITVGVVGKLGCMKSLTPSITVKEGGDILSLEEKFQGGTGINLTPPPPSIVRYVTVETIVLSCQALSIGYLVH
ncbi:D-alanine--D-alanine ligase [Linum perenne]